jgi:hypothetical protein
MDALNHRYPKNFDLKQNEQQQDIERRTYEFKGSLQREFEELMDD